ncbi:hypothetical protein PINS_up020246 [Pythium insidiosum]|nr:hypothetical protein PINS_up020246 [Pythium insidiosum]
MHPRRVSASASPPPPRHPQSSSSGALSAFSLPPPHAFDELTPVSSTTISSPSGAAPPHPLTGDSDLHSSAGIGPRKSSSDDLAAEVSPSPPCNTVSEARLLYRKWRAGAGLATSSRRHERDPGYARAPEAPTAAAGATAFLRSPEQLPRIAEKTENMPLFANSFDPTRRRACSRSSSATRRHRRRRRCDRRAASFGNSNSRTPDGADAVCRWACQRGLKDSVVNDMCARSSSTWFGDLYVSSSGQHGTKKSVQSHFRRLPARYAFHQRNPDEININVQLKKDDDGNVISNVCEVVVVSPDRDSLLDGITRFVVKGSFLDDDRQIELKRRIEDNLARLSLGDDGDERPSNESEAKTPVAATTASAAEATETNLAEKLGVLKMVDQHEIKDEWSLNMAELKIDTTVGTGRSGNTYSALWRGTRVAVKVVDASAQNAAMSEDLLNEFIARSPS